MSIPPVDAPLLITIPKAHPIMMPAKIQAGKELRFKDKGEVNCRQIG